MQDKSIHDNPCHPQILVQIKMRTLRKEICLFLQEEEIWFDFSAWWVYPIPLQSKQETYNLTPQVVKLTGSKFQIHLIFYSCQANTGVNTETPNWDHLLDMEQANRERKLCDWGASGLASVFWLVESILWEYSETFTINKGMEKSKAI